MRNAKLRFSVRTLFVLFVVVSVMLVILANGIRNQIHETTMMVSISYATPGKSKPFSFDHAFWEKVRRHPEVQDLLDIEKPLDANAWMRSRFTVTPLKNSEVLKLTVLRYGYHDDASLEEFPDLLEAIAEEMCERAEAEGATVNILQNPGMPIETSPFSMLR